MNKNLTLAIIGSLLLSLTSTTALAKGGGRDLTTGIAFPSDNSALWQNGAVLKESESNFELLLGLDNTDVLGSWVGSTSGLGIGLGLTTAGDDLGILGGFGVGIGSIAFGLDAIWVPDTGGFSVDAGMLLPLSLLRFALVVTDIDGGVGSIIAGLGFQASNMVRLEADFDYNTDTENFTLLPALAVEVQNLSLMAGLTIPMSDDGGDTDFRFGVGFWLTSNLMLEYLHNVVLDEHTVGVKFQF